MLGTAGIRFPSAAILLTSGVLVQQGQIGLGGTVAFGVLGAIVGNQIGYWVGYRAGRELVLTWRRYVKLTPELLERQERGLHKRRQNGSLDGELSERELAVLRLLVGELSASQIAHSLYVSPSTVRSHVKSIYRKLGVSSRKDAVVEARTRRFV
jgi:DNA-binding NarL/FixJ family response regulator